MIAFTEQLAAHLQNSFVAHGFSCPVYCNAAPYSTEDVTAARLVLESADDLIDGNMTCSLNFSLTVSLRLHELNDPPSFSIWSKCIYSALLAATADFRKYQPLPGQPDSDPLILQWTQGRPQAQADDSGYHAAISFTLIVQF